MKKLTILSALFLSITIFLGTSNASATAWQMNLNPMCTNNQSSQWDYKTRDTTSCISLIRIAGGPSYYMRGSSVNSLGQSRSDTMLIKQGGGDVDLTGDCMQAGYQYYVKSRNDYFESSYRYANGDFYY